MLGTVILGCIIELIGSIILIYNYAQTSSEGFSGNWPWMLMGAVLMIAGMILMYAAFRPVEM